MANFGEYLDSKANAEKEKAEAKQQEDGKIEQEQIEEEPKEKPENVLENTETEKEESEKETPKEFDFYAEASKRLGREIKSDEDLVLKQEVQVEVQKEKEYLSEFSKNYDAFYKETGGTVEQFIFANKDVNSLSPEQIVRESLRSKPENRGLTDAQLDFLYKKEYTFDEESDSEEEVEMKKIKFQQAVNAGKENMISIQQKYKTTSDNSIAAREAKQAELQKQAEQEALLWSEQVQRTEVKGFEIPIDDKFKVIHNIPDDAKKSVKEIASDVTMQKWLQTYLDNSGKVDVEKIQRDIYRRDNFDKILKDAVEQARAYERSLSIKEEKNINFQSSGKPAVDKRTKDQKQKDDLISSYYKSKGIKV